MLLPALLKNKKRLWFLSPVICSARVKKVGQDFNEKFLYALTQIENIKQEDIYEQRCFPLPQRDAILMFWENYSRQWKKAVLRFCLVVHA